MGKLLMSHIGKIEIKPNISIIFTLRYTNVQCWEVCISGPFVEKGKPRFRDMVSHTGFGRQAPGL